MHEVGGAFLPSFPLFMRRYTASAALFRQGDGETYRAFARAPEAARAGAPGRIARLAAAAGARGEGRAAVWAGLAAAAEARAAEFRLPEVAAALRGFSLAGERRHSAAFCALLRRAQTLLRQPEAAAAVRPEDAVALARAVAELRMPDSGLLRLVAGAVVAGRGRGLSPRQLAQLAAAYSALNVRDTDLFAMIATKIPDYLAELTPAETCALLHSFTRAAMYYEPLFRAILERLGPGLSVEEPFPASERAALPPEAAAMAIVSLGRLVSRAGPVVSSEVVDLARAVTGDALIPCAARAVNCMHEAPLARLMDALALLRVSAVSAWTTQILPAVARRFGGRSGPLPPGGSGARCTDCRLAVDALISLPPAVKAAAAFDDALRAAARGFAAVLRADPRPEALAQAVATLQRARQNSPVFTLLVPVVAAFAKLSEAELQRSLSVGAAQSLYGVLEGVSVKDNAQLDKGVSALRRVLREGSFPSEPPTEPLQNTVSVHCGGVAAAGAPFFAVDENLGTYPAPDILPPAAAQAELAVAPAVK